MSKGVDIDFSLEINKGLDVVFMRINSLRKYLKFDGFTGHFEIAFLPMAGGIDEQDWEWVEDIELVKYEFNKLKK